MNLTEYRGYHYSSWTIYGSKGSWYAYRFGVRICCNSADMTMIKQMIDNHDNDHREWVKSRRK